MPTVELLEISASAVRTVNLVFIVQSIYLRTLFLKRNSKIFDYQAGISCNAARKIPIVA